MSTKTYVDWEALLSVIKCQDYTNLNQHSDTEWNNQLVKDCVVKAMSCSATWFCGILYDHKHLQMAIVNCTQGSNMYTLSLSLSLKAYHCFSNIERMLQCDMFQQKQNGIQCIVLFGNVIFASSVEGDKNIKQWNIKTLLPFGHHNPKFWRMDFWYW